MHASARVEPWQVRACELAADYRQAFGRDAVVDLVCYRRHGHQEIDNPMFTQPLMYKAIRKHPTVLDRYAAELADAGVISGADEVVALRRELIREYEQEHAARMQSAPAAQSVRSVQSERSDQGVQGERGVQSEEQAGGGDGSAAPPRRRALVETGADLATLRRLGRELTTLPASFAAHRVVATLLSQRARMVESGEGVDWAMAEQLAWASLANDGFHVRLSGQDVERGTFSQRHAVVHDQNDGGRYTPLHHISSGEAAEGAAGGAGGDGAGGEAGGGAARPARVELCNSSLSEFAVLGYEYGYSLERPDALVLWEAQFGDFANTAQCVVDQFVAAGESKWEAQSGLVMLLPHGLEGGGPEHSSARLERYLQLCDDDERASTAGAARIENELQLQAVNLQVCSPTTPANYFHLLRRQLARPYRKPLVVMAPKGLLRHRAVASALAELGPGTRFEPVLPAMAEAELAPPARVRRVVFCSGRVHVDLVAALRAVAAAAEEEEEGGGADGERTAEGAGAASDAAAPSPGAGGIDVAVVKLEQLCPFPTDGVLEALRRYPRATEHVWCQEEPLNAGAWSYVRPRLEMARAEAGAGTGRGSLRYVGRPPSAAPATGLQELHDAELRALVADAIS